MEEDIKILEVLLIHAENTLSDEEAQAIEHLIKAYKELEEMEENHRKENGKLREKVKQLEEEREKINKQLDLDYVDNNYIPVSLVKEKIEEYKKKIIEAQKEDDDCKQIYYEQEIKIMQELLENRK